MINPVLELGNGKWAINESSLLGYTRFGEQNNVDNFIPEVFSFTRATSGTLVNSQGLIEDSCYNYLSWTEDFTNVAWGKVSSTVTMNDIPNPVNGGSGVGKLVNTTTANGYIQQFDFLRSVNNTFTVYVKAGTATSMKISVGSPTRIVDLLTGVGTGNGTFTSTSLSGGWWKIVFQADPGVNGTKLLMINTLVAGDYIYIYAPQVTQGLNERPYLKTTNRLNVPRIDFTETSVRRNLINYSEEFDRGNWFKGDVTVTPNATVSPDGNLTAEKVTEKTGTDYYFEYQNIGAVLNQPSTFSIYAKAAERNWIILQTGGANYAWFNLANGTVGTKVGTGTTTMVNVGNGWYRCSISTTNTTGPGNPVILFAIANADNSYLYPAVVGLGLYVWGAQLEASVTLTPYQKTTLTNVSSTGALLVEPQRSNLNLYSQDFDNSFWSKLNATVTPNIIISPDGTSTADAMIENNTIALRDMMNISVPAISTASVYTFSCYVKLIGLNRYVSMRANSTLSNNNASGFVYDLQNNVVIKDATNYGTFTNAGKNVQILSNGWVRLSMSFQSSTANIYLKIEMSSSPTVAVDGQLTTYLGDNVSGIYLWGAQLEAGPNATSYIPTTSANVTRNGESSVIDLQPNGLLNQNNFTLFVEGFLYDGLTSIMFNLSSNVLTDVPDSIGFYGRLSGIYAISNAFTSVGSPIANNSTYKVIIQVNGTVVKFYRNGSQLGATQTVRVFNYRYLNIAGSASSTFSIKNLKLYDRTLTDAECINLTT